MKSAAAYTNQRRVMAEAGNTKVQQIGNIATNYGRLQPVLPSKASPLTPVSCGPNFTEYVYFKGCRVLKHSTCSIPIPLPTTFIFKFKGIQSGNPGSGNFYVSGEYPNHTFHFSIFDVNGINVSSWLANQIANATTINVTLDGDQSVYVIGNRTSSTNNGSYWSFSILGTSQAGDDGIDDNFIVTYT